MTTAAPPSPKRATRDRRDPYQLQERVEQDLLARTALLFEALRQLTGEPRIEPLHHARSNARRLRVALRFFDPLFPASEAKQIQQQLRRLIRAFNAVRTLDHNIQLLRKATHQAADHGEAAHAAILQRQLAQRQTALGQLRELIGTLQVSHFEPRMVALIRRRDRQLDSARLLQAASAELQRLRRVVRRRHEQYGKDRGQRAFRRFRHSVKRYRYALETCQTIFDAPLKGRLSAVAALHDLLSACEEVEDLIETLQDMLPGAAKSEKSLAKALEKTIKYFEREIGRRRDAVDEFLQADRRWRKKIRLRADAE